MYKVLTFAPENLAQSAMSTRVAPHSPPPPPLESGRVGGVAAVEVLAPLAVAVKALALLEKSVATAPLERVGGAAVEEMAVPAPLEEVAPVPLVVVVVVLEPLEVIKLPAPLVVSFDACVAQGGSGRCCEEVPQHYGDVVQAWEEFDGAQKGTTRR